MHNHCNIWIIEKQIKKKKKKLSEYLKLFEWWIAVSLLLSHIALTLNKFETNRMYLFLIKDIVKVLSLLNRHFIQTNERNNIPVILLQLTVYFYHWFSEVTEEVKNFILPLLFWTLKYLLHRKQTFWMKMKAWHIKVFNRKQLKNIAILLF